MAMAVSGAASAGAEDATAPAAASATTIQEVVVTAERREQNVQRVPAAISVVNGAAQQLRGETALADLQTQAPNLTFAFTSNTSQFFIRGVGDIFVNAGGDPGVAFYQDDAYVSDQTTTNQALFDVDHIEVLRGPQGALYGRNAVGGAIDVISAKPTDTLTASIAAELGDYGRRNSEGYVSGPLGVADTDVRLSYQIQNLDGYTKNLLAGQAGAPDSLDDLHSQAFRLQTLTRLPTGGTLRLIYSYYHEAENGPALGVKPTPGIVYPAEAVFGAAPTADPRATYANFGSYKAQTSNLNLDYVQPLGGETLTILGAYRSSSQTMLNDCDGTVALACTYYRPTSGEDYYADIHLASPDNDVFRWLVGGTYVNYRVNQYDYVPLISLASYFIPGSAPNAQFPITVTDGGVLRTESFAAYGDARFQLTHMFAVTGQIRYSETTKSAVQFETIPQFGVSILGYTGPGSYLKNTSVPFKVGVEGQLTSDLLVYASYATAHKDGAINLGALQPQPVKPEDVTSTEVGEKATFFERRLQVNGAVFYSDYDNLQISQIHNTQTVLANVPKATIKGAELEVLAVPAPNLRLSANLGFLDAKFVEFSNSPTIPGAAGGPVMNLAGNELPYDARWSVNLDASYGFSPIAGYDGLVDFQYSWKDRVYFTEFNFPDNSQAPVGVLNFSGSISPHGGRWKLYAYVHNLTNEIITTGTTIYAGSLGAEKSVSYAPPRQFGIGFMYRY